MADPTNPAAETLTRWIGAHVHELRACVYGANLDEVYDRVADLLLSAEISEYPELAAGVSDEEIKIAYKAACHFAS